MVFQCKMKGKNRPEFFEVVLQRSTGQRHPAFACQGRHGLEDLCFSVFESVRFVCNNTRPAAAVDKRSISHDRII